ncbi:MAG: epoxyqueuosine reductase QueH [Patescibacteria group bacterium]
MKSKLLLHVCCATCAAYVLETLSRVFKVSAFYYNPNIYPPDEYHKRFSETVEYCRKSGIPFIEAQPDHDSWLLLTRGHEEDPERGERCTICYQMRLEKTAVYARENGFGVFGTDLSISPHKDAQRLNSIGRELEVQYGIRYLEADFKKRDGFKKAMEISRSNNFYRQRYCGCEYSMHD